MRLDAARDRLTAYDRHRFDFQLALRDGDFQAAYHAAKAMVRADPGSTDAIREAALSALRVNRPAEAIALSRQLDPRRGMLALNEHYWYAGTSAHHLLGQHRRELREAKHGRALHPGLLSTLEYEIRALAALGRTRDVHRRLDEALTLAPQPGWSFATLARTAAVELRAHGHAAAAADVLARGLDWLERRPAAVRETETHRFAYAQLLYLAERWDEAHVGFDALARERPDVLAYAGYTAVSLARLGRDEEARLLAESLATTAWAYRWAQTPHYWQARTAALLGERELAVAHLRSALERHLPFVSMLHDEWDPARTLLHTESDFETLRAYAPFRALLETKG